MRIWNLQHGDPLVLVVSSDARLGETNYCDDQIWQISIGGGVPSSLALETTYGLRARTMRLFPRFIEGNKVALDPLSFPKKPTIKQIFPNYIAITFSPFSLIDVKAEYWVPDSSSIIGRLKVTNNDKYNRELFVEWVSQLTPTDGQPMIPINIQAAPILSGRTENLLPVVFITGGPQPGKGSYPTLSLQSKLVPGSSKKFIWSHAALNDTEKSFSKARDYVKKNWDAEKSRIEMINSGLIEIYTGNQDWDATFHLSQKQALNLLIDYKKYLNYPSLVINRGPDQGYSLSGDGKDYNHLWNGQTPLEVYFYCGLVLPAEVKIGKGLLRNYLSTQDVSGFIDWKPGLAGQRSGLLATPILASIAWRIFNHSEEDAFLAEIYPQLLKFYQTWLSVTKDQDNDGIPEWDHPIQAGLDDHPLYSLWHDWSLGVDIKTSENPALCAFLYRENRILIKIAKKLGLLEYLPQLEESNDMLRSRIVAFWDAKKSFFIDWDRDTHSTFETQLIMRCQGESVCEINRKFPQPVRFLVRIETKNHGARYPDIFIHGLSASGQARVEHLSGAEFKWFLGRGTLTGNHVYKTLGRIEIRNLDSADFVELYAVGYDTLNQSGLLPLWANAIDTEIAKQLVDRTITNPEKFWRPYGFPANATPVESEEDAMIHSVHMPWNSMIGEGLLKYGYRSEAAELISKLMSAIIQNLKEHQSFYRYYDANSGKGIGEINALNGFAPLALFLQTLGVKIISQRRVVLSGVNPFPWPVTIKYKGLIILRQEEKSVVIFPDGQTVNVTDPRPHLVSLENI